MGIFTPVYPRGGFAPRRNYPSKTYPKKVTFMFKAEDVWSAAAAATRINEGYLKEPKFKGHEDANGYFVQTQTHEANKTLVRKLLDANQGWTEEDVAVGAEARAYWQAQLMKIVGDRANDFERMAIAVANKETIENNYDLAVLSSLIASAQRGKTRDAVNDVKLSVDSKPQGVVGEHMVLKNAEVLTVGPMADFGKFRVDVKCEDNLYTWWSGVSYATGAKISVKGKVKGHIKDRGTNAAVTQLNYVKEI